jgi:predicted nucleic acid-binding protein
MTTNSVFVDATHWIALYYPKDNNHQKALAIDKKVKKVSLWTTELILIEILDFFAAKGKYWRSSAAKIVSAISSHPKVRVFPLAETPFESAFAEFRKYEDKGWSLTDCASFIVMRDNAVTTAISYDKHFEQALFQVMD